MSTSNKLRFSLLAVAFPWATALACGGRTGDLEPSDVTSSSGTHSATGTGTSTGIGATSSSPGPSGTTTVGGGTSPPSGTVSHPPTGSGGFLSGSGGSPSYAGNYGAGGWYDDGCTYPACNCTDCVSGCACSTGMQNLAACVLECNAGGGGSFGAGGSVGIAGSPNGPSSCVSQTGTTTISETCPTVGLPVNTCCTNAGHCGVELIPDPAPPNLPFLGGCQLAQQPGYDTAACPDLGSLIGAAPSVGVSGCCRPDGTCGVDLGLVGVGCVQTVKGGVPIFCSFPDAGTGPVDSGVTTRVPVDAGRD